LFHAENDEGIKWSLQIQPDPWLVNGQQRPLALFLCLVECPASEPTVTTRFTISIFDEKEGKKLYELKSIPVPLAISTTGSVPYNARLPIGNWQQFLNIPSVTVHAIIEYEKEQVEETNISSEASSVVYYPDCWRSDFEKLFISQTGSDVCFIIDGQEIKAHKLILAARSPVFAAMFLSNMMEKILERIEIPEIDPDVFNALLRYIYTAQVQVTEDNAEPLLAAADKYLLPSLKFKCEQFIIKHVTAENCVEMLVLADLHNAMNLKKMTEKLFYSRHTELRKTEAWKTLKSLHPDLAFDVVEGLLDL